MTKMATLLDNGVLVAGQDLCFLTRARIRMVQSSMLDKVCEPMMSIQKVPKFFWIVSNKGVHAPKSN